MLVMIDLDNTLADRQAAVMAWATEFCDEHRLPVGTAEWILELDEDGYADRRTVVERIRSTHGLAASTDDLLDAYRRRVIELTTLTPGAAECLATLRHDGHTIVVVTNGSSVQQHAKIDALGLRSAVDAVVVSDDVGISKPDPRIFELAARIVGRDTGDLAGAWMVGDCPMRDIAAAAALGARTAWMHRGRTWTDPHVAPTVTLDSLADLPPAITASVA